MIKKSKKTTDYNQPATKKDLKNLELATKEELKKLATKEELKKLATKEELKKLATKEELAAVKKDVANLNTKFDKMLIKQIDMEIRMETFATKDEMNAGFSEVLSAIDNLSKKVEDNKIEMASNLVAHDRFNNNFVKIKKELKMESLETTEPFSV